MPAYIIDIVEIIQETLESGLCSGKRFLIVPITIITRMGRHANMLIIDTVKKTIEHFEPYGGEKNVEKTLYGENNQVASNLNKISNSLNLMYLSPETSCPSFGPQRYDSFCPNFAHNFNTNIGYCVAWSIWYSELRLLYPDVSSKDLITKARTNLGFNFCRFISGYAQSIMEFSKKYNLVTQNQGGVDFVVSYTKKL